MASEYVTTLLLKMQDEATSQWNRFQSDIERGAGRIERQFDKIKTVALGAFSVYTLKNFVDESNKAEVAANRLQTALASAGAAGETDQMIKYAEALQQQTTFSHDDVEMADAMLISFTKLHGTALQPLTKATLDLAAGMHLSAEQAATLVGKTIEGGAGLARYGISVKGAKTESEKLQMVTEGIEKVFGNFAANEVNTAAGKMEQFKNEIADVREKFGDIINSVLVHVLPLFQSLAKILESLPAPMQASILALGGLAVALNLVGVSLGPIGLGLAALTAASMGLAVSIGNMAKTSTVISAQGDEVDKLVKHYGDLSKAMKAMEIQKLENELDDLLLKIQSQGQETKVGATVMNDALTLLGGSFAGMHYKVITGLSQEGQAWQQQAMNINAALNKILSAKVATDKQTHGQQAATLTLGALNDQISKQKKGLDDLIPGSQAYISALAAIQLEQAKLDKEMKDSITLAAIQNEQRMKGSVRALAAMGPQISDVTEQHANLSKNMQQLGAGQLQLPEMTVPPLPDMPWDKPSEYATIQKYQQAVEMTVRGIGSAFGAMLQGKDADAKQILKSIANSFIDMAESAMWAASAMASAKSISTFWTSMAADAPLLIAGFGALETARAFLNSFHQGGSFFVNAPASTEVPIMVRGGERGIIQTEQQQKNNPIGGGATYHLTMNFNAHGTDEEFVSKAILNTLRKTGGKIEDVFVNKRNVLTLGS